MKQLDLGLTSETRQVDGPHARLRDAASVLVLLDDWHAAGWVRLLDVRFARFLHAEQPDAPGLLLLAAALASHQLGRGHVCLDLAATLHGPGQVLNLPPEFRSPAGEDTLPPSPADVLGTLALKDWEAALHPGVVSDGSRLAPLVYEGGRLYLYRYWRYERQVAHGIASRVGAGDERVSAGRIHPILEQLFPLEPADGTLDWQRVACALAARQRFAIVTGGPGTGKTTTVVRLLALLQALHFEERTNPAASVPAERPWLPLRIRLAAPTGKAAARLSESIAARVGELPLESLPGGAQLAGSIPTQVATLHRLLGGRPHVQQRRYHADNPLPLDVLVIDEASMVSLSDMADVVAALPPKAQLILIGDKDQLSSVEAGAVLGELCQRAGQGHYLPATSDWLAQAMGRTLPHPYVDEQGTPLDQAVAMLRTSHRFGKDSGIGQLAHAVNEGRATEARALLDAPPPDLAHLRAGSVEDAGFASLVLYGDAAGPVGAPVSGTPPRHGYGHYLEAVAAEPVAGDSPAYDEWAGAVLRAHQACQILCVLRAGPWGVEGMNAAIARILHAQDRISALSGWYAGRPVMVTRNNPALRLTNGDIGVVLPYPADAGGATALRVAFPDGEAAGVRWFAPNRLDDVETVYALTVHKSQGSEFQHAVLVLPPSPTPVLTRELLYTGITRASRWFTLVNPGGAGLLRQAIGQRVYRSGGLGELLAGMR